MYLLVTVTMYYYLRQLPPSLQLHVLDPFATQNLLDVSARETRAQSSSPLSRVVSSISMLSGGIERQGNGMQMQPRANARKETRIEQQFAPVTTQPEMLSPYVQGPS